jgi:hypothetical protein
MMYAEGHGLEKNISIAMEWYHKAAEQGYVLAQRLLGDCYEAEKDIAKAVHWYLMAAKQGESTAQTNLGLMYGVGQDIMKNALISYGLLEMAAAAGNETAMDIRYVIAKELNSAQIDEAHALAGDPEKLWKLIENTIQK